jgi:hypothetical protein
MAGNLPEDSGDEARLRDFERRLAAIETAPMLHNAAIGAGGLVVLNGGGITVSEGGVVTVVGTLAVTGTGTVAGTLQVTGTETVSGTLQVTGTETVSGNLKVTGTETIDGALVIASGGSIQVGSAGGTATMEPTVVRLADSTGNYTGLPTSTTTLGDADVTIPSWATHARVFAVSRVQVLNTSGAQSSVLVTMTNDVSGTPDVTDAQQSIPTNYTENIAMFNVTTVTPVGTGVRCRLQARSLVSAGLSGEWRLSVFAVCSRE